MKTSIKTTVWDSAFPANISLFKVNYRNIRKRCEICSMSTILLLTLNIFHTFSSVSIDDLEQVNVSRVVTSENFMTIICLHWFHLINPLLTNAPFRYPFLGVHKWNTGVKRFKKNLILKSLSCMCVDCKKKGNITLVPDEL